MRRVLIAALAASCLTWAAPTASGADSCPNADRRVGLSAGLPDCRAFELVSPAYKVGGIGVGQSPRGTDRYGTLNQSGHAAYDGDRFAASGNVGSTLLDEGFSSVMSWAFAERAGDGSGWRSHSPLTHALQRREFTRFVSVTAASDDLSRVTWSSNVQFALFPEMVTEGIDAFNAWYLGDWEGRWELLSVNDLAQAGAGLSPLSSATAYAKALVGGDGSVAAIWGGLHGLGGPGDPTHLPDPPDHPGWPDRLGGRSVYLADATAPADSFAGTGTRTLVNVCTGAGAARTRLPLRTDGAKLADQACPDAQSGRAGRLVSRWGAGLTTGMGPDLSDPTANVISRDGSRVFFMAPDPRLPPGGIPPDFNPGTTACTAATGEDTSCPPQLYVRQLDAQGNPSVRWISRSRSMATGGGYGGVMIAGQDASLLGPAVFEGATPDGDKVFFRTTSPLTPDDPNGVKDGGGNVVAPPAGGVTTGPASPSSWDLYMYDLPDSPAADPGDGVLTRVSGGPGGAGDCNNPQVPDALYGSSSRRAATLRFVSDDGLRAYFVCATPLPGAGIPSDPDRLTSPGGDASTTTDSNLYLYDATRPAPAERWRFLARIPRSTDNVVARCASTGGSPGPLLNNLAGASEVAFSGATTMSNCVRGTADGGFVTLITDRRLTADDPASSPETADVYGFDADSDDLTRISAHRDGADVAPYPCGTTGTAAAARCFGDDGLRNNGGSSGSDTPLPPLGVATVPSTPGDRVAFFQSRSRLVPEDVNDVYDVYRWRNGELSLVSSGAADAQHALYRGNDRSGSNVYLVTQQPLTWQDTDAVADIYVARVDGGIPEPAEPIGCAVLGGGCQGPAAAALRAAPQTHTPGGSNAAPRARVRLSLRRLSAVQRRRAARRSVLALRVRTSEPGVVRVGVRARLGRRSVKVAGARRRVSKAGSKTLRLRLDRRARRVLRRGRVLRLTVTVAQARADRRTATFRLWRPRS